jgi:hypothetical protein
VNECGRLQRVAGPFLTDEFLRDGAKVGVDLLKQGALSPAVPCRNVAEQPRDLAGLSWDRFQECLL